MPEGFEENISWIRCEDCGKKIHHKKIWDAKANKFKDAWDKDYVHLCNYCEHQRIRR